MGVIIDSFNLNISAKMSCCAWVWYYYITELHAYDFMEKGFIIKRGVICVRYCVLYGIKPTVLNLVKDPGHIWISWSYGGNCSFLVLPLVQHLKAFMTWTAPSSVALSQCHFFPSTLSNSSYSSIFHSGL